MIVKSQMVHNIHRHTLMQDKIMIHQRRVYRYALPYASYWDISLDCGHQGFENSSTPKTAPLSALNYKLHIVWACTSYSNPFWPPSAVIHERTWQSPGSQSSLSCLCSLTVSRLTASEFPSINLLPHKPIPFNHPFKSSFNFSLHSCDMHTWGIFYIKGLIQIQVGLLLDPCKEEILCEWSHSENAILD